MTQTYRGNVYILSLNKGMFYVGYTERKDYVRIEEHFKGEGALWTKLYPPLQLLAFFPGSKEDENKLTIEIMKAIGFHYVRGGRYCNPYMWQPPLELCQDRQILDILKTTLPNINERTQIEVLKESIPDHFERCERCKLFGHTDTFCYSVAFSLGKCYRCNKSGHKSIDCKELIFHDS